MIRLRFRKKPIRAKVDHLGITYADKKDAEVQFQSLMKKHLRLPVRVYTL